MSKASVLFILLFAGLALSLESCQPTCSIPTQSFAEIRIENAVTNVDKIDVYIDSTLFDQSFYTLTSNNDLLGTRAFGYYHTFVSGKLALVPGKHHIQAYRSSDHALVTDTLMNLAAHRQSLLFFGRLGGTATQKPRMMYLDDALRSIDNNNTFARFVHAVSDLPALDVYFHQSVQYDSNHRPKPDLVLAYGQISDASGHGTGTGRLASDYVAIPTVGTDGLLVTPSGDTSNIVVRIKIPFSSLRLLATVVIRGQSRPVGSEVAVSTALIEDGQQSNQTFLADFPIYGIRLCNATRFDSLSVLMLNSPPDDKQYGPRSTRNTPLPLQERILRVPRGSIGRALDSQQYMPVNPADHGMCDFWLSPAPQLINSGLAPGDTIFHFKQISNANERYTFVGIDFTPLNAGASRYGVISLRDSVSNPPDLTMGRVRFVNASPDHPMNFTFGSTPFQLKQGDIGIADDKLGHYTMTLTDGTQSGSVDFNLLPSTPLTIILLPATATNPFPYVIANR